MLIRHATRIDGAVLDIRVGARIDEVDQTLAPRAGEDVFDAAGGTVLPGLHDHHVHLYSAAAAESSVQVGPPQVRDRDTLARALSTAAIGDDGWIRAVGYHDSVAGPLDRTTLDTLAPSVPVRVQHRSGALWTLNSAALHRMGMAGHPDGRIRSADPVWSDAAARRRIDLANLSTRLLRLGVTGITDATPDWDIGDATTLTGLQQKLHVLSPGKRILHDDDLDLDELAAWIAERHGSTGAVAVHCVTAAQLVVTIAALRQAGTHPQDRIEHAAVVPPDAIADLAELGVTVVTQPNFIAERGDQYLAEVEVHEHEHLWRVASLLRAGVPVAFSTDMPFGRGDPWAAMQAAVHRTTASGAVLGPGERVGARRALMMFLGWPGQPARARAVVPGQPGDLCLLTVPPEAAVAQLDAELVAATVIGGRLVYENAR
ncbi:amidohydrolase family protein [Mycobacterium sp.]|uniref:amidohydrolase family protein n=1 Tax=Mycobacterium sp. TaxID=1785 RepID=UPI001274730F|nr:amidohydrolase family protein [Mycobacterium sp.]KAA8961769.1 MAG: amidohydrolase family protein [Mycobacterium sp.]